MSTAGHSVRVNRYRFGVDQLAAERLRLVAEAYEPVSRRFLTANVPSHPNVALDIGCGIIDHGLLPNSDIISYTI